MEKKLIMFFSALFFALTIQAQVFTQGDLNLSLQPVATHDSLQCGSSGYMVYDIVIQNSFTGDSVIVIDLVFHQVLFAEENTTGQNPWNVTVTFGNSYHSDYQVVGGLIHFGYNATKVISGPDTLNNIGNTWNLAVPNPCDYDSVSGRVYADYNNNCVFDSSDVPLNGMNIYAVGYVSSPPNTTPVGGGRTDSTGYYDLHLQKTRLLHYMVYLEPFYRFIFPSSGCSSWLIDSITALPNHNVDFALQCGNNLDVQCGATAPQFARPLVPFILGPRVSNTGCEVVSGTLRLVLDANVTYSAAQSTNPASSVSGDTLIWNYTNLTNLSTAGYWNSFLAGVHLTPDLSVNIGDTLCFQVFTQTPAGDINTANNYASLCIPVVNSFDPNAKEVSPQGEGAEGFIPASTDELIYTVYFQNTGNAPALNVIVKDSIDAYIIPGSLKVLENSHNMSPSWVGTDNRLVWFKFNNINLPDSASNEAASHGMVKFKVKLKPGLATGTEIKNRADIYFDTNPAIYTNTALNTIATPTMAEQLRVATAMKIFPNPAADEVLLNLDVKQGNNFSIVIQTMEGKRILQDNNLGWLPEGNYNKTIPISGLRSGIYLVACKTTEGIVYRKLVVQR